MAYKAKKSKVSILLTILSIILVILTILKFDVVTNAIDPDGKLGLAGMTSDAWPIALGVTLVVLGLAMAASPWVAVALIAVGSLMIISKVYSITKRKPNKPDLTPQ